MSDWITITEEQVIKGLTDAPVRDLAVKGELAMAERAVVPEIARLVNGFAN